MYYIIIHDVRYVCILFLMNIVQRDGQGTLGIRLSLERGPRALESVAVPAAPSEFSPALEIRGRMV